MKRSTTTSIVAALAVCACALAWQRSGIGALKREVLELEEELGDASGLEARAEQGSMPRGGAGANGAGQGARRVPTVEELRALIPDGEKGLAGMAIFALIPDMVEKVENCSADELLAIAAALANSALSDQVKSFDGFFQMLILIMVSEDEPEKALAYFDANAELLGGAQDVRSSLLGELAKRDPKLALSKAERDGASTREIQQAKLAIALELLRSDAPAGLEVLESIDQRDFMPGMNAIVAVARDPAVASNLLVEAGRRDPGDETRRAIFEGVLGAAMLSGGGEAVDAEIAEFGDLAGQERNRVVASLAEQFVAMDPQWTIGFVHENTDEVYRPGALRDVLVSWARADYNAAGNWLGEQAPSDERDKMIAGFARTVAPVDPEAARAWVDEIGDEGLRTNLLQNLAQDGSLGVPTGRIVPETTENSD